MEENAVTADYTYIEDLSSLIENLPDDSIVSRTFHEDDHTKVVLFGFAKGQELSEHTASHPAILYFLEGHCRLTLGEDDQQAQPGTWVHMPAQLPHSVHASTQARMMLILLRD
ncbi:MAG: cupin domain-containing protein [Anaerolineales bacterium]|nr:cupin domain-containing protein [Anaerolineales bacterium]